MDTPYLDKIMLAAEEVRGYERLGPRGHLEHIRDYRKLTPEQQHAHLTDPQAGHGLNPLALNDWRGPEARAAGLRFHTEVHTGWARQIKGSKDAEKVPVHPRADPFQGWSPAELRSLSPAEELEGDPYSGYMDR